VEFKDLVKLLKSNRRTIVSYGGLFILFGVAFFYFFPKTYKTAGSFYVTRGVDLVERSDFRYEGYYAQQAGTNYAETLIGLLESVDVRRNALANLEIPVTESTLREAARNIKAKKAAPQLVTLSVKGSSPELAERFWLVLSQEVIAVSDKLNKNAGDSALSVTLVEDTPVTYETFNNVYLDIFIGLAFGLLLGSFVAVLKEYLS
jgi:capsular polysaccharide biosynthesis protein